MYAVRELSLPSSHPIRRRCPRTLPTLEEAGVYEELEEEEVIGWEGTEPVETWLEEKDWGESEERIEMENWCLWAESQRYRRRRQYRTRLHRTLSHLRQ
jgi:hypothetical protein